MNIIEFAIKNNDSYLIILMDCSDISCIVEENKTSCKIVMKSGLEHIVPGTYRAISNRFIYSLNNRAKNYDDSIIRPSMRVYHYKDNLEPDAILFDIHQMNAFKQALIDYGIEPTELSE